MAKIIQLSPHIANLIAAGEVVERPASVIKELVEHSIDAGANKITVEIKNGGSLYMSVTDNGSGMTKEDAEAFDKRAQVLVEQFDAIEVNNEGLHANGRFTLGENIADQGGVRVAMTALRDSWGESLPEPIDGFTAEQRFYIGYATLWAQNITDQEKERLTKEDVHSLGVNRVNATLRNIQSFDDDFDIKEGDAMYMAPEERVIIW